MPYQPLIIGVSGHIQSQFIKECLDAGMNMVEAKPLYADRLKEILEISKEWKGEWPRAKDLL